MQESRAERIRRAEEILRSASSTLAEAAATLPAGVADVVEAVVGSLRAGGKVLLCGNGGSAADAQHIAAELAGRLRRERPRRPRRRASRRNRRNEDRNFDPAGQ